VPWIEPERVALARSVDLLSYLQANEPGELKKSGLNEYRTASHGSLVISNGCWYWHRGQVGGRSAVDYLMKVRGMGFPEAAEAVLGGRTAPVSPLPVKKPETERARKALLLPPPAHFPARMLAYLQSRGIHADVLRKSVEAGIIYEGQYYGSPVCVFVGHDESGETRFACMRSIYGGMKQDCAGSDKRYSFRIPARDSGSAGLCVTESPIDALSHACLFPELGGCRLSLGGTSDAALMAFLERNPQIERISFCLDNDAAGRTASSKIRSKLAEIYPRIAVTIDPPDIGKDCNEMLQTIAPEQKHERAGYRKEAGASL
jgi:hypothetical protein